MLITQFESSNLESCRDFQHKVVALKSDPVGRAGSTLATGPSFTIGTMRILLVEDDTILADALCRALVQCAYAVDVVGDGEQADNALAVESYDLAILDIGLPG